MPSNSGRLQVYLPTDVRLPVSASMFRATSWLEHHGRSFAMRPGPGTVSTFETLPLARGRCT